MVCDNYVPLSGGVFEINDMVRVIGTMIKSNQFVYTTVMSSKTECTWPRRCASQNTYATQCTDNYTEKIKKSVNGFQNADFLVRN